MTKEFKIPKVAPQALFPSAAIDHHLKMAKKTAARHDYRISVSGGRKSKKKGGNKNCPCGNTPTKVVSYPAGASNLMSPNPNDNISTAQQQFANNVCASSGDAMGDSWSQTGGSDLEKFIKTLNKMSGGKRQYNKKKKLSKKKLKKNNKTKRKKNKDSKRSKTSKNKRK